LVCALNDTSLRVAVEEKARAFGCAEAISNLAIIDAVRFLQHRERCTPCFGWESPLIPLPEGITPPAGVKRERLCGVLECYWKSPCDTHRIMPTASLEECMDKELVRDMEDAIGKAPTQAAGAAPAVGKAARPSDRGPEADAAKKRNAEEQAAAIILNRMAESASAFLAAIQELVQQGASWRSAAGQQIDGLAGRFDQLAEVVFGQQLVNGVAQERYEELCQAVAASREANARHQADLESLREGTQERMDWFSVRLEELSGQLALQRDDLSALQAKVAGLTHLHSTVASLSSKVDSWCERLDKQGEVLQSLCDAQNQRAAVLDQFLDVLNRLRSATVAPAVKI
jgi:hypothetical protein